MNLESKRKTLVDITLPTWAKVRFFATIKELSINEAVEHLLSEALSNCIYMQEVISSPKNLATSKSPRHKVSAGDQVML
jgi:hypothetical protein